MKIFSPGFLVLLISILISGCSKKKDKEAEKPARQLSSDKTILILKVEGGKENIEVSSNTQWELSGLPAWLKANPTSGSGNGKIELVYDPNTSANELKASISLKSNGLDPVVISITQLQPEINITRFTEHGKGGDQLVIEGTGFSEEKTENIVKVNEQAATVLSSSKTSITVTVPAKAGDGKISVKTNTRTQISTTDFYYDWIGVVSTFNYSPSPYAIPNDIVFDNQGNMFISDSNLGQIFKVGADGVVRVFAGSGIPGQDDGAASEASFGGPRSMATDAGGNIFVIDYNNFCIRKITPEGVVSTVAGDRTRHGTTDGDLSVASFDYPEGIAVDKNGIIYVSEYYANKIRKIEGNVVSTFAGSETGGDLDGTGTAARMLVPEGLRLDADGNILVAASHNYKIKKITPAGLVTTLAGSQVGFVDGAAAQARFRFPRGIGTDSKGNIVVADQDNHAIRYISKKGWVSTLGGVGNDAAFIDGTGPAARFCLPVNVNIAPNGDVWVVDGCGGRIRKIILQ